MFLAVSRLVVLFGEFACYWMFWAVVMWSLDNWLRRSRILFGFMFGLYVGLMVFGCSGVVKVFSGVC